MRSCWMQNLGRAFGKRWWAMRKGKRHPACFLSLLSQDLLAGPGGHLGPRPTQTLSNCSLSCSWADSDCAVKRWPGLDSFWILWLPGSQTAFIWSWSGSKYPGDSVSGCFRWQEYGRLRLCSAPGTVSLSSVSHLYTGIWTHTETGWLQRLTV